MLNRSPWNWTDWSGRTLGQGVGGSLLSLFANGEDGFLFYPMVAAGLFQDTAGTTPVTADGDPVGRDVDQSGKGNNALQATAGKRPFWKLNSGKPYILMDGVDDFLQQASIIPGQAGTIVLAFRPAGLSLLAFCGGTGTGNKRLRLGTGTSGQIKVVYNNVTDINLSGVDMRGVDTNAILTWDASGYATYLDGAAGPTAATAPNMDGTGGGYTLGAVEGGTSSWMNCRIYFALALNRRISAAEAALLTSTCRSTYQ